MFTTRIARSRILPKTTGHSFQRRYNHNHVVPLIINGKEVSNGETFPVIGPLTDTKIWDATAASRQNVDDAVTSAQAAFPAWAATKPSERRDIFLRAAEIFGKREEELGHYMNQEIGAGPDYQKFICGLAIEGLKDTAGRIAGAMTGYAPCSIHSGMRAIVEKVPYGVVLGIAPWNAPYHLGLRSITFPLAVGNTAILKGPEFSPRCAWAIADVFREAGLPDGCLNTVTHRPSDGAQITEQLVSHPNIKKVNFTGSTRVGRVIAATAGKHLKPVLMELGGKASAIVLADANIEEAAMQCAMGAFMNAGQICMSTERVLVHNSIETEFRTAFGAAIDRIAGTPESHPVLINRQSADRNRALIADAVKRGARLEHGSLERGSDVATRMAPAVLSGVDSSMDLYQTESFGPSVSFFTFTTEAEALELANNTEYGLSASVFTSDLQSGLRLARQIESGAVHINSMTVHDELSLPHGGVKASGFGRFNGDQGLEEFLYSKTVTWMD